VARTG